VPQILLVDLARRAFNQPLAIAQGVAEQAVVIEAALAGLPSVSFDGREAMPLRTAASDEASLRTQLAAGSQGSGPLYLLPDRDSGIAVIPVMGSLWHRWGYGYAAMRSALRQALAAPEVKGVLFEIDSPGGEAHGCFDLVDEIYAARAVKPVWAIANEAAMSAAYAIGSAAEVFVAPRTASVGSIGVITMLMDCSGFLAEMGLQIRIVKGGALKDQGHPFGPPEDAALAAIQRRVDADYRLFAELVARNRGLAADAVMATEADVFTGVEARERGLVTATASHAETVETFAEILRERAALPA
jgi:signal peptide peptidase SppA